MLCRGNSLKFGHLLSFSLGLLLFSLARLLSDTVNPSADNQQSEQKQEQREQFYLNWQRLIDSKSRLMNSTGIPELRQTPGYGWIDDQYISLQNNVYLEQFGLHYCKMDKNMGSTMQAILCYLDNPIGMREFFFDKAWGPGLGKTKCGKSTSFGNLRQRFLNAVDYDFFNPSNGIFHFAITRDPLNRFVSAFINVCPSKSDSKLCFNCGRDLHCFLPRLYRHLLAHSEHLPLVRWYREWHFYPQAWYCDFDRRMADYHLLRYDRTPRFWSVLEEVFRLAGVQSLLLVDVHQALRFKKAKHSTSNLAPQFIAHIRASNELLEYVYTIYFLDFLWFGYDLNGQSEG